ncbi:hypothetical protein [Clostridium sp. KNHs205]|uniref:hypothetical protein n=1 Tax=Clostridium sp. KNHs205 TaxID=1449050 RepID=UPI00051C7778|nr:hypothetical protein [Clostridium sp. KNHs205]
MDCELYIKSKNSKMEYAIFLKKLLEQKIDITLKEDEDSISLCTYCMTLIIDLDERIGLDFVKDEYSFNADICVGIQIFRNYVSEGISIVFELLNEIIDSTSDYFLLLESSTYVILKRDAQSYYSHLPSNYEIRLPFNLLNVEIEHTNF